MKFDLLRLSCLASGLLLLGCEEDDAASSDQSLAPAGTTNTDPGSPSINPTLGGVPNMPNAADPVTPAPTPPPIVDAEGNPVEPVPDLDAEEEVLVRFELPAAGDRYVYAATPENNSVAVIDASTLNIQSVEAGQRPTFLQTVQNTDTALVINTGSEDVTVLRTSSGVSRTETLEAVAGVNALAVAPDGRHAVVFYDARRAGSGGVGSFQDISVLNLEQGNERSVAMTVGFRPTDVAFDATGTTAFIVTEDGVSILDLDEVDDRGPFIADTVPLGSDAKALDVSVTADGGYALARHTDDSVLRLVDLDERTLHTLDIAQFFNAAPGDASDGGVPPAAAAAIVTDLDLSPTGDFAIAVVRDRRSVLKVPVPGAFEDPSLVEAVVLPTEIVGSVAISADGSIALLYTTAQDDNERISLYDIDSGSVRTVQLPKAVNAVSIAPDSRTAMIVHQKLNGNPDEPGIDPDLLVDRSFGYSVLDLETAFSKLQVTPVPVGPTTIVPDSSHLFVLFPDASLREVHRVELESFLVERFTLGSTPISIGTVPRANKVFVTQDHADGRITFIDWDTAETESVTGFQLNSRIRE